MKNKKYLIGFLLIIVLSLTWYLFLKKSDFQVFFNVRTSTGTVFQGVQEMTAVLSKKQRTKLIKQEKYKLIEVEVDKDEAVFIYEWNFKSINDSLTAVTVNITEKNRSIYNRLTVPFFNTDFKKQQLQFVTDFRDELNRHLAKFNVKVTGERSFTKVRVAYINLQSIQQEKAQTMIGNDAIITEFLHRNKIKIKGTPYLEVLNWDQKTEKLDFNYCFPIDEKQPEIEDKNIKFKYLPAQKGLEAIYHGNYRTSDRAWFALIDYAERNNIQINNKPIEHFFANPFNGGDELSWETKIIIPFTK